MQCIRNGLVQALSQTRDDLMTACSHYLSPTGATAGISTLMSRNCSGDAASWPQDAQLTRDASIPPNTRSTNDAWASWPWNPAEL